MDVTKPYEFIRFGAMHVTKPYEFIGIGAMDGLKPYEFIGFGAETCCIDQRKLTRVTAGLRGPPGGPPRPYVEVFGTSGALPEVPGAHHEPNQKTDERKRID